MEGMEIVIISILVALLFFLLTDRTEQFQQGIENAKPNVVKQCDYNDKHLNNRCKEIIQGCSKLRIDTKKMQNNLANGCELKKEAKTTRETLSNRRDCVTDVERLIRSKYAKTDLGSQVKNMPAKDSKDEILLNVNLETISPYDKNGSFSGSEISSS
jgi:uncharacterized membrane protein YgaE (UPF0421/DUF939 family)